MCNGRNVGTRRLSRMARKEGAGPTELLACERYVMQEGADGTLGALGNGNESRGRGPGNVVRGHQTNAPSSTDSLPEGPTRDSTGSSSGDCL